MQTWEKSRIILTGCEAFDRAINLTIFGQQSKSESFINDLAAKIKSCSVNLETLNYASIGHQCLAKYAKDGEYYRAVIKSCSANSCVVEFIDYGHHQVTACQDLKCMPSVFANVQPQCHVFSLQAEGESTCGHWTTLVAEQVSREFMYRELEIEVCMFKDGSVIAKSPDISKFLLDRGFMSPRAEIAGFAQQPHLSLPKFSLRQKLNVSVGAVLPDGSFFCRDFGMEDNLNSLLDDLYNAYSGTNATPLVGASNGHYCCANFLEDGNWYRAQILEINGSEAMVRFIDYGNTEKCDVSSLMTLHPEFTEIPVQGIHCILSGGLRQQEMVKILNVLVDKCVKVEFVNINLNPYPVRMYYNGELVGLTSPNKTRNVSHNPLVTSDTIAVPINTEIPIRITHVENPGRIWVQLIDFQAKMIRLTGALTSIYSSAQADTHRLPRVDKGLVCCVKSQRSRNWCRGQVTFVCNDSVEVKFVDFGHTELTHASNLKPLAVDFQRLSHFAIPCALDNVVSVSGKWCDASVEYLQEYVAKSGVTAKFTAKHEELYSAQVFVSSKSDKILLNKDIVDKGLGKLAAAADGGVLMDETAPCQSVRSPRVISRQYYSSHGVSRVGAQVLVSICANPTPEEYWVFPLGGHLQHTFRRLEEELSCYLHTVPSAFSDMYRGMPCIYLTDKEALRASVLSPSDVAFVEVMLVDLGQKKRVSVTSLRPIQSSHLSLVPPLAIRCTMNGIVEPKSKFWSSSAMEAFSRFRAENKKDVLCTVHACVTDGVSELLMARISTPFTDFADTLVESGNCRYVEPFGKVPSPYSLKSYLYAGPGGIVGTEETYYVTHVERADLFYCQLSNKFDVIDDFMDKVQNHCRNRKTHGAALQDLSRATLCFVEYAEKWYRAHFKSAAPVCDAARAVVFLVDYGNVITVPLDDVMLFDQNSDLAHTPMHAVPCSLSEIVTQIQDHEKAERMVSKLEDMILNKEFKSLITGSTNGKLHLDLFTDGTQRNRVNSAFADEISPRLESIAALPKNDNDPLLKGSYREIHNIEPKSCHTVVVAHINSPDDFYVRLDANRDVFERCCKEVDGFYTAQRSQDYQVTSLRKNDIVCVKHPVTFTWCRGAVSDVDDARPDTAVVEFVDFGNKESVSISSSTKKLSLDMQHCPRFAIHCRLNNVRPVGEMWTVENRKHFEDLCRSSACRLRFNTFDVTENKWAVDLKIDGKSVLRMMAASNQASFSVSPSSNPSSSHEQVQTKNIDSLKIGEVKTVYISHVESISEVYLQPRETQEALEAMMDDINAAADSYKSVTQPNGTWSYLCRYCEDGRLYRANVVATQDDGKVKIIFSDYGNCSLVHSDELRVMPKRFLSLPEQAIKCGVQCPSDVDVKDAVSKLEDLSVEESVSICARFLDVSSLPVKVSLTVRYQDGSETDLVDFFSGRDAQHAKSRLTASYLKLNVETGNNLKVYVSQVDGPSKVWLQISSNTADLDDLMEDIERHCTQAATVRKPASLAPGTPCLAKYVVDSGWYRGTVVESDGAAAEILFVDYGNKETVKAEDILSVDHRFLVLPKQAVRCRLRNVRGLRDWKAEDTVKLVERVSDIELDACFHRSESSPELYDVDLIYPCGTSLNDEWNETLDSRLAAAAYAISSQSDESARGKHVVTDRGDHVIVENVLPVPKLDFSSSGHERSDDGKPDVTIPNVSIEIGAAEGGYVSYCENPALFYVQLSRCEPAMDRIYDEIAKIHGSEQSADARVDVGTLCIAKSPDDGEWYRARCTGTAGSKLSVLFIDYGNAAEVLQSDTRPISTDLASFPILAVRCRLADLVLLGESWKIATDTFLDMTLDQDLKITFVSKDVRGFYDVTLMVSDEDVCDRIVNKHGDVVSHNKLVEMEMTTVGVDVGGFLFETASFWCVRIIHVDEQNSRFHALNLAVPNGRLRDTITRCLRDRSEKNAADYVTMTDLEAASLYLKRCGENWHCVKVLDVGDDEACVLDLSEGKCGRAGRGDDLLPCSADVRRVAENTLLSCALSVEFSKDIVVENVYVVEMKTRDDRGDWIVGVSGVESEFAAAETTVSSVSTLSSALSKLEESDTKEWAEAHAADITRFCEIGGAMMRDCPESIRNYLEQVLLLTLIVPNATDCEKQRNFEGGKRLGHRPEATPAKKMKLESGPKVEHATMWEFDVGDTFEAIVASVENPGKIFLRPYLLISESASDNKPIGDSEDKTERILADKYCLVRTYDCISSVDHWVRGEALEKDGDFFLINDLDTGVDFKGAAENIIPVGESLVGWPAFCMECSLAGVKPVNGDDSWNTTPTAELKSFVHGFNVSDAVEVKIVAVRDGLDGKVFEVDIYVNRESLSKRLIALNVASAVDKENADRDLRKTFDGAENSDCAGDTMPTFDLLAVPWKVVRTSLKESYAENLSDSVFVYEAEELLVWNRGTHGKRQLSSFRIYRSTTVSESCGSGVGKNSAFESTDEEMRNRGNLEKSTVSLDSSLLNLLTPPDDVIRELDSSGCGIDEKSAELNLSPTHVANGDQAGCSEDTRERDPGRDERADELAKELVDRILTDLSDEGVECDGHDRTSSSSDTVDIRIVAVHSYRGSSDGSRTVVDDDNAPGSVEDTVIHDEDNLPIRSDAIRKNDVDVPDTIPISCDHAADSASPNRRDKVTNPEIHSEIDADCLVDRDDCSTDTVTENYVDCKGVKTSGEESSEEDRRADCQDNKSTDTYMTAEENVDSAAHSDSETEQDERCISAVSRVNGVEPGHCQASEHVDPDERSRNDGFSPVSETPLSPFQVPLPSDSEDEFSLSEDRRAEGSAPKFEDVDAANGFGDVALNVEVDASGQLVKRPSLPGENAATEDIESTSPMYASGIPIETATDVCRTTSTECEQREPAGQDSARIDETPASSLVPAEAYREALSVSTDGTESPSADAATLNVERACLDDSLCLLVAADSCSGSHGHKDFGMCCLPKMQLEMGELADVCFVKTGGAPLTVVLQFDAGWESEELRRLMTKTNSADRVSRLQTCDYFETDTVCLAMCADASFERARILDLKHDSASVELIDHGESFNLRKESLHKLPEELSIYPRQSAQCRLHGLEIIPDHRTAEDVWNQMIAPLLDEALEGKSLKAEICDLGDDSGRLPGVKILILEGDDCWQVLSELLLAEGLVNHAGDREQTSTDAEWTTINDSSYEELVKGSDSSVVMHSSNANLSIIEDAFEEDLPEITPEKKSMRDVTDSDVRNAAENISANALSDALIIAKFGFDDAVGSPCSVHDTFDKNQSGECHAA